MLSLYTVGFLKIGVKTDRSSTSGFDSSFLVLRNAFFKEIGLSFQGNHFHKIKRIGRIVHFVASKFCQQSIGHKFQILRHQFGIHSNQTHRQGLCNKDAFYIQSVYKDFRNAFLWNFVDDVVVVQVNCKITVQAFVS